MKYLGERIVWNERYSNAYAFYTILYMRALEEHKQTISIPRLSEDIDDSDEELTIEYSNIQEKILEMYTGRICDITEPNVWYHSYKDSNGDLKVFSDADNICDIYDSSCYTDTIFAYIDHCRITHVYLPKGCITSFILGGSNFDTSRTDIIFHNNNTDGVIKDIPFLVGLNQVLSCKKTVICGIPCYEVKHNRNIIYVRAFKMTEDVCELHYDNCGIITKSDLNGNFRSTVLGDETTYYYEDKQIYKTDPDGVYYSKGSTSPKWIKFENLYVRRFTKTTYESSLSSIVKDMGDTLIKYDPNTWRFKNESAAYFEAVIAGWPVAKVIRYTGNSIILHKYRHDSSQRPEDFTLDSWIRHVIRFCESLPFTHGELRPTDIVYDDPQQLRVINLDISKRLDGTFFAANAPNELFSYTNRYNIGKLILDLANLDELIDYYAENPEPPTNPSEYVALAWQYRN